MPEPRVAALLTCHDRRERTLACLDALFAQRDTGADISVTLVDSGSRDGTSAAVAEKYPQVRVISCPSGVYWCGGMRIAHRAAAVANPDFFLWLNDDTMLFSNALHTLLSAHAKLASARPQPAIVVGSVRNPDNGLHTYGGVVRVSRWHPFRYRLVPPGGKILPCDTFQGNCVLVPRDAAAIVGNLDARFTHGIGDTDYGLRANRLGCGTFVAPLFVGTCRKNDPSVDWDAPSLPLRARWARVRSVKGLPPAEHLVFVRRHGGVLWPIYYAMPYLRAAMPRLASRGAS
jgi:GT2 family glycosyltransferase